MRLVRLQAPMFFSLGDEIRQVTPTGSAVVTRTQAWSACLIWGLDWCKVTDHTAGWC